MKTVILGAGVTGLATGYHTGFPIYEATEHHGGICRSYWKDSFQFSQGGPHWIFENGQTTEAMDFIRSLVELKSYERRAGVYFNKMFPYPFQTYTQQPIVAQHGYFKDWLSKKFSQAECNLFFNPFNEKYTAGLYDGIIQYDAFKTPPAGSLGFVPRFHDPVGGLGELMDNMALTCDIYYTHKAIDIDTKNKLVFFEGGEVKQYDRLISTIPLDRMLDLCGQKDFDLPFTSVFVLNIGALPDVNLPTEHWIYVPYCKSGFYRIGFYTNVDSGKAPPGMVGLSVEIAWWRDMKYEDLDLDTIIYHITTELRSWRFIKEVLVVDPTWVETAYTWLRSEEERERHIAWLKERDIECVGRYATWRFQGMAESIQQGLAVK